MHAVTVAKDGFHDAEMLMVVADGAADHRIRFPTLHHDRANGRMVADHRTLRLFLSYPATLHDLVILAPVLFEARIGFIIHDLEINARFDL